MYRNIFFSFFKRATRVSNEASEAGDGGPGKTARARARDNEAEREGVRVRTKTRGDEATDEEPLREQKTPWSSRRRRLARATRTRRGRGGHVLGRVRKSVRNWV
jgi:hypothetical protein